MKRGATIIGAPPYFVSSYEFSRSVVIKNVSKCIIKVTSDEKV